MSHDDISNSMSIVKLVFKVVILCLALGFIFYMFGKEFDFYDLYTGLSSHDLAPWDYEEFLRDLHNTIPTESPILDTISGLVIVISSVAYVAGFAINLFWYILLGL